MSEIKRVGAQVEMKKYSEVKIKSSLREYRLNLAKFFLILLLQLFVLVLHPQEDFPTFFLVPRTSESRQVPCACRKRAPMFGHTLFRSRDRADSGEGLAIPPAHNRDSTEVPSCLFVPSCVVCLS